MSASKPSSQHTEPEMQDRTSQSGLQHRLSLEIWETILFHLQDEDLENVAAASSYLSVAAVRPRCYRLRWVNMNHFTQFQQDTADDSLCWVTVSVTLGRGRYRDGINTPKLDFSVVLPTIVSFSNLTTLKAFAIWFPLHDVLSIVHQLPKLEHLGLYAIRRTWDARREATVPSRPYRTALKTIEFTNVPGHALKEDEGFHDLVSLLCFSAIRHFRTTMGTFIDILAFALDDDIRTFAVHFASTLEVLDVRTYLDEPVDPSCLDCDDYSDAITHIIQNCAPSLRRFWIWSTSPCPTPEATIHLPSAVDVIGPQDLLLGFTFGERISCIWVPSPSPSSRSPWKVSLGIPDCAETATLTKLSLSRWAASDMPVEKIFASYPELSELSIEPSSPMSKTRLLKLGYFLSQMPKLVGLSIIAPPKVCKRYRLSPKDHSEIFACWKQHCPSLQYARLQWDSKHVWGPPTRRKMISSRPQVPLFIPQDVIASQSHSETYSSRYFF